MMIHLLIRRAAMLTLALLITYGLFHNADTLQETASVLEEQEPQDVRVTVRDPDGDVPTVEPETIRRALERAGIEAIVVAEPDSRSEGDGAARQERSPRPPEDGSDARQDGDGEGDRDGDGNGRQGPGRGGSGGNGGRGEDRAVACNGDFAVLDIHLAALFAARACADIGESEAP